MSENTKPEQGTIVWTDLTVENAEAVRDFYAAVAGWKPQPVSMGEYDDYSMCTASGAGSAGICHARGVNANIPPQWLVYITVEDLDASIERCKELGGEVVDGPRKLGNNRFCVIRDPAGAVAGLYE